MKHLSLLIIGLILTFSSFGQTLKIQVGSTFSSLDWKLGGTELFYQNKIGFSAFAGLDYLNRKYYNLSSNIGFVSKGGKEDILIIDMHKFPEETITMKAYLDYISLNTIVEVKYPITDVLSPYISLGPRFDYLISSSSDMGFPDNMKKYNYGLLVGGGLKYGISKIQIGVQANYYLNFIKIADIPAGGDIPGLSMNDNTTSISLILGYKLQ